LNTAAVKGGSDYTAMFNMEPYLEKGFTDSFHQLILQTPCQELNPRYVTELI